MVKAGDLMFQVDPRPYQTALEHAEARLLQAESQLSQAKAQVSASQAQLEQAIAKVASDEAQLHEIRRPISVRTQLDVNRYTPLAQRGSVSQQELDNAVQNNLANVATVAAARATVQNSQAGVSHARAAVERAQADVKAQEANIAAARAAVADAKLNLGYTRVLAPITGVAGFRVANIGDYVGPNDPNPLMTVSQVRPDLCGVPLSEQRALALFRQWEVDPQAFRDLQLELILADGTVYPKRGRPVALDRQVDVTTGTVHARGVFPNPGGVLRPGQYAKVRDGRRGEEKRAPNPTASRAGRAGRPTDRRDRARRHGGRAHSEDRRARRLAVGRRRGTQVRRARHRRRWRARAIGSESAPGVECAGRSRPPEVEETHHGEILHQSPHRRDGDLDPHGDHRRRRAGAAADCAVSEDRPARDPAHGTLPRRRRRHARAVGGDADRAADERRGQHALHVLDQPGQQRSDGAAGGLRRHHRRQRGPGPNATSGTRKPLRSSPPRW